MSTLLPLIESIRKQEEMVRNITSFVDTLSSSLPAFCSPDTGQIMRDARLPGIERLIMEEGE